MPDTIEPRKPECSLADFIALLNMGAEVVGLQTSEFATQHLGISFAMLHHWAMTQEAMATGVWARAPHQERSDVIRKALALAHCLDPAQGVLFSQELGVGQGWVLRTPTDCILFAPTDYGFMPVVLTKGAYTRTQYAAPAVAACVDDHAALGAAVSFTLERGAARVTEVRPGGGDA